MSENLEIFASSKEQINQYEDCILEEIVEKLIDCRKYINVNNDKIIEGFTVGEYFTVIKYIMKISLLNLKEDNYLIVEKEEKLIEKIINNTDISRDKAIKIIDYITFDYEYRHKLNIQVTPVLKRNDSYLVFCYLILDSSHWRNFQKNVSIKNSTIFQSIFNTEKEEFMIKDVTKCIDDMKVGDLETYFDINIPPDIQIDFCIFSRKCNKLLVLEFKNILTPDSIIEHDNATSNKINDAFKQLEKISDNSKKIVDSIKNKYPSAQITEIPVQCEVKYTVVTSEYLGNFDKVNVPVINLKILKNLLKNSNGDLDIIINNLNNRNYLNVADGAFEIEYLNMEFDKYSIQYPAYKVHLPKKVYSSYLSYDEMQFQIEKILKNMGKRVIPLEEIMNYIENSGKN